MSADPRPTDPGGTATVVFRLAGPMQAWGTARGRAINPTSDHPTRSGLIGFVANALGYDYSTPLDALTGCRWAVRADRPGRLANDFHTAGSGTYPLLPGDLYANPRWQKNALADLDAGQPPTLREGDYTAPRNVRPTPDGTSLTGAAGNTAMMDDQYLADAIFTAACTGPGSLITEIAAALHAPARVLFLGRKAYPTCGPLLIGVTDDTAPAGALADQPPHVRATPGPWKVWADEPFPGSAPGVPVADQPTRFDTRTHRTRMEWAGLLPAPATTEPADTEVAAESVGPPATTATFAPTVDFFTTGGSR